MINECEGCVLWEITEDCLHINIEGCPCKNCLIKVVCIIPCLDLKIHAAKARGDDNLYEK